MAEASEQQRSTGVTTALPPADVVSYEPYRALSLLALAGFALAVVYAVLVLLGGLTPLLRSYPRLMIVLVIVAPLAGAQLALMRKKRSPGEIAAHAGLGLAALAAVLGIGGLLAFSGTSPWLAPGGMVGWLLVAAAVFLSLLARVRIDGSEGTLSGLGLANWGLTLGLFFGLVYGAYSIASNFASVGQARLCADEFMEQLSKTDDPDAVMNAFVMTMPERSRPTSNVRQTIEIEYNTSSDPRGSQPGLFSRFSQQQFVRLLGLPGVKYRYERVEAKKFDRGGYEVLMVYKIDAPVGEYEVTVGAIGQDTDTGAGRRRKWHIDYNKCGIRNDGPIRRTPENAELATAFFNSRNMVLEWTTSVKNGNDPRTVNPGLAAYLGYIGTLQPSTRMKLIEQRLRQLPPAAAATGLGGRGVWEASAAGQADRESLAKYQAGGIIDASQLWAAREPAKKEMLKEMISLMAGVDGPGWMGLMCDITPLESSIPGFRVVGDEGEFTIPARIATYDPVEMKPHYIVEADVVLVGPMKSVPSMVSPYRVTKLRLLRGQAAPDPKKQQPQPGGMR